MIPRFVSICALTLLGTAVDTAAQGTQIPLPSFTSTFSSASQTRGFYFQAPAGSAFAISGLRVPDETRHGLQAVEVVRLSGDPRLGSVTATQAHFIADAPSATVLTTNVVVSPGEWIGVLGACGDAAVMHNSYGVGGFSSSVLGASITLNRLQCAANIAATGGNQPVSAGVGSIGRVEVYVVPASGLAQVTPFGSGCGGTEEFASYYEQFSAGAFDLGGAAGAETVVENLPNGTGLTVQSAAAQWFVPTAPDLALGDDDVSAPQALGFTFSLPGGVNVTDVRVCSNGYLWLSNSAVADFSPTAGELVSQDPRICVLWQDLRPAAGGGSGTIHFDADPANGRAYVTWLGVQEFGRPGVTITAQCAIDANGSFELRYGAASIGGGGGDQPIVGYSPGNGSLEPPASDLSTLPIVTRPDRSVPDLGLSSARPVEGTTMAISITDIPPGTTLGTVILSPMQVLPGVQPFPGLGACQQFVGLDNVSYFTPFGSRHVLNVMIPATGFTGARVYAQAVTLSPGVNPLEVASSNGLEWVIGG